MPPDETPKDESASVEPIVEPIVEPVNEEITEVETPIVETSEDETAEIELLRVEPPEIQETQSTPVEVPTLQEPATEPPPPPETQPEPTPEPPKEPLTTQSSPITDSAPPPVVPTPPIAPPTTPPIAPTPLPRSSSEELTTGDPLQITPAQHDPKYTKDIPQKILDLTDEELDEARLLWAREHIAEAQAQGNRNRLARMNKIMDEIEAFVRTKPNATTYEIANKMNMSKKSTSNYIQKLVNAGRIKASGNSSNRRYFG